MEWYWILIPVAGLLALLILYYILSQRSVIFGAILGDSSPTLESGATSFARVQSTRSEPMWIPNRGIANKVKYQLQDNGHDVRIVVAGNQGYYLYSRPKVSGYRYTEPLRARQVGDTVVVTLPSETSGKEVAPKEIEVKHAKILKRK